MKFITRCANAHNNIILSNPKCMMTLMMMSLVRLFGSFGRGAKGCQKQFRNWDIRPYISISISIIL